VVTTALAAARVSSASGVVVGADHQPGGDTAGGAVRLRVEYGDVEP
jgi:hypothetical protein